MQILGLDIGVDDLKWAITCLIMVAPMIQNAITPREPSYFKQMHMSPEWARSRRISKTDRPLIERTSQLLSELEGHVLPVVRGRELLDVATVLQLQESELSARIASKERALVDCGLLNEPAGVSYYLEVLLLLSFSPARHRSTEEVGLLAMKQAYAARDLRDAIRNLRGAIGPAD